MINPSGKESKYSTTDYEIYSKTSQSYDTTRNPIGLEIILESFATVTHCSLREQTILDAGCGTGNYMKALHNEIGSCYGIDINRDMLAQAKSKFGVISNVHLAQGSLLNLPFQDEFFDGVMCNQVIHHLGDPNGTEAFSNIKTMFSSTHRLLRAQGVLVLNTCSHQQLVDGYWWAELIPQAVEKMSRRIPSIKQTIKLLKVVGFQIEEIIVPRREILQGPSYLDPRGPLQKSFRDGDSTWALISEGELHQALERIRTMNEDGRIKVFLDKREERRKSVGQTTFLFARKH